MAVRSPHLPEGVLNSYITITLYAHFLCSDTVQHPDISCTDGLQHTSLECSFSILKVPDFCAALLSSTTLAAARAPLLLYTHSETL